MSNAPGGRAIALCAGLALAGFVLPAHADDNPGPASVAVLPYAPLFGALPQSTADKATEEVTTELGASNSGNDFNVVDTSSKKSGDSSGAKADAAASGKKGMQAALAQIEKGKGFINARKFPLAAENLQKGIGAFLTHFQAADDFKPLSEAYVQLALAEVKLGNDDAAAKALDDLIRIDPERVLSTPAVPKELAAQHAKRRAAYFGNTRGSMRIDSVPAGGQVTIDGRDLGETPLLATQVLAGDHYVRVTKEGVGIASDKITVGEDQEKVSFTLADEEASGPLAGIAARLKKNTIDESLLSAVSKAGTDAKADYVIFGAIRKNTSTDNLNLKSYALRTKDGFIAELPDLEFDTEMLGANIEILKLVTDLLQKIQNQTFAENPGNLTLFEGVSSPKNTDAPSVIVLAPASAGGAPASGGSEGGGEVVAAPSGSGHHRGPVTAETVVETPKPVAEPAPAASGESGESVLEQLRRRRKQKSEQEAAPEEVKPKPKPAEEEEETEAPPPPKKKKNKRVVEETKPEETVAPAASTEEPTLDEDGNEVPKKKVVLEPPKKKKKTSLSTLTPEQLERMQRADKANKKDDNTGAIVGGVIGGVVGAAAIGVGAYFLFKPNPATSATAHIGWSGM